MKFSVAYGVCMVVVLIIADANRDGHGYMKTGIILAGMLISLVLAIGARLISNTAARRQRRRW